MFFLRNSTLFIVYTGGHATKMTTMHTCIDNDLSINPTVYTNWYHMSPFLLWMFSLKSSELTCVLELHKLDFKTESCIVCYEITITDASVARYKPYVVWNILPLNSSSFYILLNRQCIMSNIILRKVNASLTKMSSIFVWITGECLVMFLRCMYWCLPKVA